MKSSFRPTTPDDEAQLIAFLARAFSVSEDAAFLHPALLRWKFWTPREDYPDPRSWVLDRDGRIVAHAGLWPMMRHGSRGAHMIDWAADAGVPGAGVSLLQRIIGLFDFVFSIGGSEMTCKVLPAFGFREVAEAWTAARPLRPLRQALLRQERSWKAPIRLLRNYWWSRAPLIVSPPGWTAQPTQPEPADAFVRYLQTCPGAHTTLYRLAHNGACQGDFALTVIEQQARIAGVWLDAHATPEALAAAYKLAGSEARRFPDACEISAGGSTQLSEAAAAEAGLRVRSRWPVFLLRKKGAFPEMPFDFQLADNDAVFFSHGRPEFLT